ncbi:muconolactone Delta-isomerase family protein [Protofrankia symbiont of Coriaria ruscifolia]|uniref:muconolactone Delta-isomerase family protein n=1 Tax=Protofrankia symbiont of Coriaria ruscifolia TaxID=1306542 RepID=UPI001041808A|nr:muconolactone Delta-isomerase family protein [Protofrankia symbiont of Coriaria ruscifolia]
MALFAVLTAQNPTGISADEFRARLPEGFAYFTQLVEKGIVTHSWIRVGESGGLNIFDVSSHAELSDALYNNPLSPHLTFTVYPLAQPEDFDVDADAAAAAARTAGSPATAG